MKKNENNNDNNHNNDNSYPNANNIPKLRPKYLHIKITPTRPMNFFANFCARNVNIISAIVLERYMS